MKKEVLITGGAGFIGSHIVDEFINDQNYDVIIIDNLISGRIKNIKDKELTFYKADVRDQKKVKEIFENHNIKYVIHEAAQVSVSSSLKDPIYDADQNIIGLINILNNCVEYKVEKIIFASTAAVYGIPERLPITENHKTLPLSFYGLSKLTAENYIKLYNNLYNLNYIIFRYANVYGERQNSKGEAGVVAIFSEKAFKNEEIYIHGDGKQTRDFIYVKDVAKVNYLAVKQDVKNEIFNISTKTKTSVKDLFEIIQEETGGIDCSHSGERVGDIRDSYLDNNKVKEILNWKYEYNLKSGLKSYFRSNEDGRDELFKK